MDNEAKLTIFGSIPMEYTQSNGEIPKWDAFAYNDREDSEEGTGLDLGIAHELENTGEIELQIASIELELSEIGESMGEGMESATGEGFEIDSDIDSEAEAA